MIKNDAWILDQCVNHDMIAPFVSSLTREDGGRPVISYGLSSYGYDIRLSPKDFRIFRHLPGEIVDPKDFNPKFLEQAELKSDEKGEYFVLPGDSYGLGVAVERLQIPDNITVICIGKSTYARAGIIANLTPGESSWVGHLTLELSNSSSSDCRVYANEGICQLLLFEGEPCQVTYEDRKGKYQNQPCAVTLAKV